MCAVLCSWLPLFLGKGTLYLDECPQMSYFLAGALLTLAFNLLHTFSMVIAFDGLREGRRKQWAAVPVAHLGAALLVILFNQHNAFLLQMVVFTCNARLSTFILATRIHFPLLSGQHKMISAGPSLYSMEYKLLMHDSCFQTVFKRLTRSLLEI